MPNNIEALRQLRRVVENAPDELFSMRFIVEEATCGTVRCALGWCLVDPWFVAHTPLGDFRGFCGLTLGASAHGGALKAAIGETFCLSEQDERNLFAFDMTALCLPNGVRKEEVFENIDLLLRGQSAKMYEAVEEQIRLEDEENEREYEEEDAKEYDDDEEKEY